MRSTVMVVLVSAFLAAATPTCQAAVPELEFQTIQLSTFVSNDSFYSSNIVPDVPAPHFPFYATLDASAAPSSSNNVIDLSISGDQYILSFDVIHTTDGPGGDLWVPRAQTTGYILVTPAEDMGIEIFGLYRVTDFMDDGHAYSHLNISVTDVTGYTPATYDFANVQTNVKTHDAQLRVGEAGGDWPEELGYLRGYPKGILLAGRTYSIHFDMMLDTGPLEELGQLPGASAVGNFTVTLGVPVVPEPSACALLAILGLVGALARPTSRLTMSQYATVIRILLGRG